LSRKSSETKVAFITTAMHGKLEKTPEEQQAALDVFRNELQHAGIKQENITDIDLKGMHQQQLRSALSDKDVIFVNGGHTFYLLLHARLSGFDKLVPELLNEGKLYVGVSAGSYIASPTIEAATWKREVKNRFGLDDLTGLGIVPFWVSPHFEEEKYGRIVIEAAAENPERPIVALSDKQAVLVETNMYKVKVIGEGPKKFYNHFEETA
jgi:dipeptidase E